MTTIFDSERATLTKLAKPVAGTLSTRLEVASVHRTETHPPKGRLIVNADDWGRDCGTTERIAECMDRGSLSSVSAMVFMEDSERSAAVARERGIDVGLHLNLTTYFSARSVPSQLAYHQERIAQYLGTHKIARVLYHPGLRTSFEYVVSAQIEQFERLYGAKPTRLDGHHHMHLCANVMAQNLLPPGTIVRRNFSFRPGEKSWLNNLYRGFQDRKIAKRHRMTDFFFSLAPIEPVSRFEGVVSLADRYVIEVGTHPINPEEYKFLAGGGILRYVGNNGIARKYALTAEEA